jgi:hypothetical protein
MVALGEEGLHNGVERSLLRDRGIPMDLAPRFEPWNSPSFLENQRNFPAEKLLCFAGQHIAWSWDGSRIVAGGADRRELDQKLRDAGINPLQVIHDFVEDPNLSYLA